MARRFRFALMWLLLLALPLQGYAAAVALHCGQAQSHGAAQHATDVGVPDAAAAPACHGGASAQAIGKVSKLKCSACAACCVGAALPAAALTFASFAPVTLPVLAVPASIVGFFTDGPDRPPRLFLS